MRKAGEFEKERKAYDEKLKQEQLERDKKKAIEEGYYIESEYEEVTVWETETESQFKGEGQE